MNTLGTAVVWGVVQVTLFSLVGAVVYALARRRGPAAGALAATASLAVVMAVTVLAFSPWPRWLTVAPRAGEPTGTGETDAANTLDAAAGAPSDRSGEAAGAAPKSTRPAAGANLAGEAWSAFWQELRQSSTTAAPTAWRWPAIVGAALGTGALVAVLRMLMGIAAVRRYRAATEAIDEPDLAELAAHLTRQMDCRKPIELRESRVLTTPATVGWRRPLVVLPATWREWTTTERRVVLAHEIAHVGRGDYAAWLLAQLSLALHFYHPLVHWLARRLRLEQELAADAWGAEASGGRETYLMTLAQMALRQDDRAENRNGTRSETIEIRAVVLAATSRPGGVGGTGGFVDCRSARPDGRHPGSGAGSPAKSQRRGSRRERPALRAGRRRDGAIHSPFRDLRAR